MPEGVVQSVGKLWQQRAAHFSHSKPKTYLTWDTAGRLLLRILGVKKYYILLPILSFANFETTLVIYHMVQKQNLIVHMYIIIPRMYTN